MRKGMLGSVAALLTGAGLVAAQTPTEILPPPRVISPRVTREAPAPVVPGPEEYTTPALPAAAPTPASTEAADAPPSTCAGGLCAGAYADCDTAGRYWFRAEYLQWWIQDLPVPPLVTRGPAAGGGGLGQPGTSVLFGGATDLGERSGGRFVGGWWLTDYKEFGLEGSFFFLGSRAARFSSAGGPDSVVARPFFDVLAGVETAKLVTAPGFLDGDIRVGVDSRLHGFEVNALANCWCTPTGRVDLIVGYRYTELNEGVGIVESSRVNPAAGLGDVRATTFDQFSTRNRYFAGQLGARGQWQWERWGLELSNKIALGGVDQEVNIRGATVVTPTGGQPVGLTGGLLALPTNIGSYDDGDFSFAYEFGVNLSYQVTACVRVTGGYSFLYLTDVARPGDQIDRRVNPSQLPTAAAPPFTPTGLAFPTFSFDDRSFWAQGFSLGLEVRF